MVVVVNKIIQAKRKTGISEVAKDVVDVLLKDESEKLTDELISDNMIDLMIPGEDSVPVLMTLAVKYLSDCPPALQQLTVCNLFSLLQQIYIYIYIYIYPSPYHING